MGLMSPDRLEQVRAARQQKKIEPAPEAVEVGATETIHGNHQSTASPALMQFHQELSNAHWTYQKRLLDLLEILARDDRTYQVTRRVALDIINEQAIVMRGVVHANLARLATEQDQPVAPTQEEKETVNVRRAGRR